MVPARLAEYGEIIFALDPDAIPYHGDTWGRHLRDHQDLPHVSRRFADRISRSDLGLLSREAHGDLERLPMLFLAVMIWGNGTVGYGPW